MGNEVKCNCLNKEDENEIVTGVSSPYLFKKRARQLGNGEQAQEPSPWRHLENPQGREPRGPEENEGHGHQTHLAGRQAVQHAFLFQAQGLAGKRILEFIQPARPGNAGMVLQVRRGTDLGTEGNLGMEGIQHSPGHSI